MAQRKSLYRDNPHVAIPVTADTVIADADLVAVNAAGTAVQADDVAGLRVLGTADAGFDNAGGLVGTLIGTPARFARVAVGAFSYAVAGSPVCGAKVYVVGVNSLSTVAGTHRVLAGYCVEPDQLSAGRWMVQPAGLLDFAPTPSELDDLTDSSTGTADGTIAVVGATDSTNQAANINNNFAEVAAQLAALRAILAANGMAVDVA